MFTKTVQRWLGICGVAATIYGGGMMFQPTVVVGHSMSPTLDDGRVIWVDRTYYKTRVPERGEVVVFKHDGETYVKRVYRGPGEKVHYLGAGSNWLGLVRASDVPELRRQYERKGALLRVGVTRVPPDAVFVLGDNFLQSEDSRELGPIPISDIIGRAHLEVDTSLLRSFEFTRRSSRRVKNHTAAPGA
ncbi:MAG TPA: signal peptidase I [Armatimonadota bacterium]|nr:signal peptidase I [Armatimonadota bacterium]